MVRDMKSTSSYIVIIIKKAKCLVSGPDVLVSEAFDSMWQPFIIILILTEIRMALKRRQSD